MSMRRSAPSAEYRRNAPWVIALITLWSGCSGPILRPQSPEIGVELPPMPDVRYVSEYTHPYGMNYVQVEAVTMVNGLDGTGSDPPPSPQRSALLDEMRRRGITNPNEIVASPNNSLVLARAVLRPGVQEGDRVDVDVRVPSRSETTNLRNGWMLATRLTEFAVLGDQIRQGHVLAAAEGPVLVDPSVDPEKNPGLATQGRILGGGVVIKSRSLGLVLSQQHRSFRLSQQVGLSINRRFHTFVDGRKQGVATPKTDDYLDLRVHPRYKDNVARYMQVVRNVAIDETASAQQARLMFLEQQLSDPLTASIAALRLEAIGGDQAKDVLKTGIASGDLEVRFYSAEALAYLDDTAAVDSLAEVARDVPAFRVNSLAALSAMDDVMAYEALRSLLEAKSVETRYGAFRALWAMNESDPFVRGEWLGDQFSYHVLDVGGTPLIHATRSFRPEIVMFGKEHYFKLPLVIEAGKNILVNGQGGTRITVSKFRPGLEPEQRVVSTRVDEVIRAIVELGGTYPDVVQALNQAHVENALSSRFAVEALPEGGRPYNRNALPSLSSDGDAVAEPAMGPEVGTPEPELFQQ